MGTDKKYSNHLVTEYKKRERNIKRIKMTSNSNYLDLDDLIEELDTHKTQKLANSEETITYNSLLHTISEIGKMADKTDKILTTKGSQGQDLTADLFANMSDSEMLSHF